MIKVSAPGKLMLFGEHSVVYQRPCIVTAVDRRMSASLEKRSDKKIVLNAPDVNLTNYTATVESLSQDHPKDAMFVMKAVLNFFRKYKIEEGVDIKTKSEFTSSLGLGSSSSVTVSVIKGLSELFEKNIDNNELFDLSYKTVLDVQGVGSGFDIAAAIFGGTLFFNLKEKVFQPIKIKNLPIIVGYTGIKADTATLVKMVRKQMEEEPEKINGIFDEITNIVNAAKIELENSNWQEVGKLMNKNQALLRNLCVSSEKLETLINASLNSEALGAKLSGAGGGDCMIALIDNGYKNNIEEAIKKASGEIIDVQLQTEGVRIGK